jgi:hypothetical protein
VETSNVTCELHDGVLESLNDEPVEKKQMHPDVDALEIGNVNGELHGDGPEAICEPHDDVPVIEIGGLVVKKKQQHLDANAMEIVNEICEPVETKRKHLDADALETSIWKKNCWMRNAKMNLTTHCCRKSLKMTKSCSDYDGGRHGEDSFW